MPVGVLGTIPDAVSHGAAADLPLAGQSAEAGLSVGGLACRGANQGKRVIILAAPGGVGRIAVQLARLAGVQVHASASSGHRAGLERLGCSKVWAYDKGDDYASTDSFDLVVDLLGGAEHERSYCALRKRGTLACLNAKPIIDRARSLASGLLSQISLRMERGLRRCFLLFRKARWTPAQGRCCPHRLLQRHSYCVTAAMLAGR